MAKPGTGVSESGEPSALPGPGCGEDGVRADEGMEVVGLWTSGSDFIVGEDPLTCTEVGSGEPLVWV